jgi:hypothetical protein
VTTIEGIVGIVLLLTGTKVAKIRQKIVQVFVRYLEDFAGKTGQAPQTSFCQS